MTTSNVNSGIAATNFAPYQDPPTPAPVPGESEQIFADPVGQIMVRGPCLTDEGGFREMFATDPWARVLGGGTIVVAAGTATFTSSLVVNDRTYVSTPVDFLPLIANLSIQSVGRPNVANTADFFFGLYSNEDPDVAIATGEFFEQVFQGSTVATQGLFRSGAGGNLQTATAAINSSATVGFRSLLIDGESVQMRDNTTSLPTTTVRFTNSIKMPGLMTDLHFAMGFRNGAVIAAPTWQVQCSVIFVKNTNRLIVNTAFL
jgi:hypothetical protein